MGHVVNPISYRITKSRYWHFTWTSLTQHNFTSLFIEDLSYDKFIKWLLHVIGMEANNMLALTTSLVKLRSNYHLNIKLSVLKESSLWPPKPKHWKKRGRNGKFYWKRNRRIWFTKNSTLLLTYLIQSYKVRMSYFNKLSWPLFRRYSYFEKGYKFLSRRYWKRNRLYFNFWEWNHENNTYSSKLLNFRIRKTKVQSKKKRKYYRYVVKYKQLQPIFNFQPSLIKSKILMYFVNVFYRRFKWLRFIKRRQRYKRRRYNRRYRRMIKKYTVRRCRYKQRSIFLKQAAVYLKYFLKIIFFEKNFLDVQYKINFFHCKNFLSSVNIIAKCIKLRAVKGFFMRTLIKKMGKLLFRHTRYIVAYKFHFSGRVAKKLRNFPETYSFGKLCLSTQNFPLDYVQIAILTKLGIIGLKVWIVRKKITNEII